MQKLKPFKRKLDVNYRNLKDVLSYNCVGKFPFLDEKSIRVIARLIHRKFGERNVP